MNLQSIIPGKAGEIAGATTGTPLSATLALPDAAAHDIPIDIPSGMVFYLKTLEIVNASTATINSLKIDGLDQQISSGMIGSDGHIDFEHYYGQAYYCDQNITVNATGSGKTVTIIARGILVQATSGGSSN